MTPALYTLLAHLLAYSPEDRERSLGAIMRKAPRWRMLRPIPVYARARVFVHGVELTEEVRYSAGRKRMASELEILMDENDELFAALSD